MRRRARRRGRPLVLLGSVALLALSGYELWIRMEDFWAWTAGIRHLSEVRGTPFIEDLRIVFEAPEMRALGYKLVFLLGSMLFGIVCLIRAGRAKGAPVLIALDVAVAGCGAALGLYSLRASDWAQTVKLLPLLLILAGLIVNCVDRAVRRRAKRKKIKHIENA